MTETANRRPRHILRWVLIAIALLVLAAAGVAAYVVRTDLGRFKEQITAYASEALGRALTVDELSVEVGRQLHVRATNVTLADATWSGKDSMLSIGSLDVTLETRSLWDGPVKIENLDAATIRLVERQNSDGVSNWQIGEPAAGDDDESTPRDGPPLLIEKLAIRDLDAVVHDPSLEQPVQIRVEKFEHGAKGERHAGALSGSVNDVPLTFTTDIGPRSHFWSGQEVTFKVAGSLGKLTLDASGNLDNLLHPASPSIDARVSGPDVAYLFGILKTTPITQGPLDASVKVSAASGKVDMAVAGTFGEFNVKADGSTGNLQELDDLKVTFKASGPNLGHVGRLVGVDRLPDRPFDVGGAVSRSSSGLNFKDVELHAGSADVTLNGTLTRPWPVEGKGLVLRMHGADIAEFRNLMQLPGVLQGPFDVTATLTQESGNLSEIHIDGTVSDFAEKVTVTLGDPKDFKGTRAEFDISGPDLSAVGKGADIAGLPELPFHVVGAGTYNVATVAFEKTTVTLGDTVAVFSGTVDTSYPGSATSVNVDASSPDLDKTLTAFGVAGAPARAAKVTTQLAIADGKVNLTGLQGSLDKATIQGSFSTGLEPFAAVVDYDVSVTVPDVAKWLPEDSTWKPAALPLQAALAGALRPEHFEFRNVTATYGDAHAKISGIIDRPPGQTDTQLEIEADIPSLAKLGTSERFLMPALPFSVNGSFEGGEDSITGKGVKAVLGQSTASMDFTYKSGDVPVVGIELTSPGIDLRPFLKPPEAGKEEEKVKRDRVIPDVEIPVAALRRLDATADIQVKELISHKRVLNDIQIKGSLQDGALRVTQFNLLGRRGTLTGNFSYVPVAADLGDYQLQAKITGTGVSFAPLDEPEAEFEKRPKTDLRGEFDTNGTSLRKMLASLDGLLVLDTNGGILPNATNRLAGMVMGDLLTEVFVTINPFAKTDDNVVLDCAVASLNVKNGVITTDPPVIVQTDRLNIFVDGKINLGTEALDMTFGTQQRKGLGISLSNITNPFTRVSGTLASPTISLNQKGAVVEGGAAVATAGLTMIAKGLHGRFLADKDPCGTAREQIREKASATKTQ